MSGHSTTKNRTRILLVVGMMLAGAAAVSTEAQQPSAQAPRKPSIYDGVLGNAASSRELSTTELQQALAQSGAIVLDARPYEEYAVSHIPGARSVRGKPGTTPALYVADVSEIAESLPDKAQPLIAYCNGLFCGRSERFAEDLMGIGYLNVSRYHGRAQADLKAPLRNAVSIPLRDASKAKDDGRLPMTDHNTRIFVVGDTGAEARAVAEAIVHNAFHNVAFFDGTLSDLPELLDVETLNGARETPG